MLSQRQHNLNTEVGLDTKMTLHTHPHPQGHNNDINNINNINKNNISNNNNKNIKTKKQENPQQ